MGWIIQPPAPEVEPERPPFPADSYPLGTTAEKDGHTWYVVWDDQDHRHYWNDTNEDV